MAGHVRTSRQPGNGPADRTRTGQRVRRPVGPARVEFARSRSGHNAQTWREDAVPNSRNEPEIIPPNLIPKGEQVPGTLAGPKEYYLLNYWRQLVPELGADAARRHVSHLRSHDDQRRRICIGHTWTPVNVAELVEQLGKIYGGAVIATHSQGGPIGHHAIRYLKQHGTLKYLEGLITIEGTGVTLAKAGLTEADFDNISYPGRKGRLLGHEHAVSRHRRRPHRSSEDRRGKAAVEYIKLDEKPSSANAWLGPLKRLH